MLFGNILLDYFLKGGPIMWPILIALLGALIVVGERFRYWTTLTHPHSKAILDEVFDDLVEGRFDSAWNRTSTNRDPFLDVIHEGLSHAHTSMLGAMQSRASDELERAEERQWVLSSLITLAPLLGLLGTVLGIMDSFSFVGDEQLAADKVSGGIAEALIATSCGLGIAILCLIPFNYFNRRITKLRNALERTINHVELIVESARQHGLDLQAFSKSRAMLTIQDHSSECRTKSIPTHPRIANA